MGRRALEDDASRFGSWIRAEKGLSSSSAYTYASTLRFVQQLFGCAEPTEESVLEVWETIQRDFPRRSAQALRVWDLYLEWSEKNYPPFPRKRTTTTSTLEPLPGCVINTLRALRIMGYSKTFISDLTAADVQEAILPNMTEDEYAFPHPGKPHTFVIVPREDMLATLEWAQHPSDDAPFVPKEPGSLYGYPKAKYPAVE